jgi:hypothetical protein
VQNPRRTPSTTKETILMTPPSDTAALVLQLQADPVMANRLLFGHRHPRESAPFHARMIAAYASALPKVLVKAFRGSAKSTTAEEVMVQGAVFRDFNYGLIVGSTYDRAVDRLKSIKHELEFNPRLLTMFGGLEGAQWGADTVVLANGVMVKAIGRGQSARGLKEANNNSRPDFAFFDDLEEEETGEHVKPVDGKAVWTWINRVLLPAMAQDRAPRVRWAGTPVGENCALESAANSPDWRTLTVPLYNGPTMGTVDEIEPNWPDVFPAEKCIEMRDEFERAGDLNGFIQEYLCKSVDNAARTFDASKIIVMPAPFDFAPKTLIVDPARTTNAKSARTGYVVTSWVGSRLYVHHAQGGYHSPSEQVDAIFKINDSFHPATVAVEKDGLEEWLMQPLRAAMSLRGDVLPLEGIRAPKDKIGFISGLQPFFNAGEVVFVQDFPDLKKELLAFPYGLKDIANALAYAVRLRPGQPVYPGFSMNHVENFVAGQRSSLWLCLNASPGLLASVLVAVQDGRVHVIQDWVREGNMPEMLQAVSMDMNALPVVSGTPQIIIPAERASPTDNAGLGTALTRLRIGHRTAPRTVENVECLTDVMRSTFAGRQQFTVAPQATWVLNALGGGYCREVVGSGILAPKQNIHATVAQALESLGRMSTTQALSEDDTAGMNGVTRGGRPYRSMLR